MKPVSFIASGSNMAIIDAGLWSHDLRAKDDQSVKYNTRDQMKCCWRSINNFSQLELKFK